MEVNCSGCGKVLTLGYDLIYKLSLHLKWVGTQVIAPNGEWLTVSKNFCQQCHDLGKDVIEYRRIKYYWEVENG